ncbi:MAG TPA: NAD-dependent epimerase/dehydratase family protein [Solirubrobacteraceae bacterium]
MRALVTGGAGFIGSNLVDALLDRGDEVSVIDDLSTGRRANVEPALDRGARLHEVDVREAGAVARVFADERPEVVFHLAAQIDVRKSVADPAFDARTNVEGTVNLLEAAREASVRRFVNTSSGGAIYGVQDRLPTPEGTLPAPMAPYGASKYCAEVYCGLYERLHGMSVCSLRYGNVYGERQDPLGEAGVIAIFCGRLLAGESPTVYGSGEQTRDYVYVGDVVTANLAAAESDAGGGFNIGTGRETDVLELVRILGELSGSADGFEPEFAPPRLGELERSWIDVDRAHAVLGWAAEVDLEEGMRRTLEWTRAVAA